MNIELFIGFLDRCLISKIPISANLLPLYINGGVDKYDFIFIRELNCMVDSVNPSHELNEFIFCSNLNNRNVMKSIVSLHLKGVPLLEVVAVCQQTVISFL